MSNKANETATKLFKFTFHTVTVNENTDRYLWPESAKAAAKDVEGAKVGKATVEAEAFVGYSQLIAQPTGFNDEQEPTFKNIRRKVYSLQRNGKVLTGIVKIEGQRYEVEQTSHDAPWNVMGEAK